MVGLSRTQANKRLCEKVESGKEAHFEPSECAEIDATLIRRLALSLPRPRKADPWKLTPFGIRIVGARIDGRIQLDNATPSGGGSLCPIEFEDCELDGGFSGAHARFSRLSFRKCRFRDPALESPGPPEAVSGQESPLQARSPPEPGSPPNEPPLPKGHSPPDRPSPPKKGSPPEAPDGREGRPLPSLGLAGAEIGTDLDLVGSRADGDPMTDTEADRDCFEEPADGNEDHFWIRLRGARIDGNLDLSCAQLRAPRDARNRHVADPPVVALDLTQTELHGDLLFVGGARSRGRIIARQAHIQGDIWMSGAKLNGLGEKALFLQNATVEGIIVLDGRYDRRSDPASYRSFKSRGEIDCHGLRLGGGFTLNRAELSPSPEYTIADAATPKTETPSDEAASDVCLCLQGANVGGSVYIGDGESVSDLRGQLQFAHLEVSNRLELRNLRLGVEAKLGPKVRTVDARSLTAKELVIDGIEPLAWEGAGAAGLQLISIDLCHADLGKVEIVKAHINGQLRAAPLCCAGDVELNARIGDKVDLEGANIAGSLDISQLRLRPTGEGLFLQNGSIGRALRLTGKSDGDRDRPRELIATRRTPLRARPGSLCLETLWRCRAPDGEHLQRIAFLDEEGVYRRLDPLDPAFGILLGSGPDADDAADILKNAAQGTTPPLAEAEGKEIRTQSQDLGRRLLPHLHSAFAVAGLVDLRGLSCGMLHDGGGRLWGRPAQILMNHFTYRQTSWDDCRDAKPSHTRVTDWRDSVLAEWLWPFRRGRVAAWLRRGGYWEPWQIRRNWIYRQFDLDPMLLASTRRKIHEEEYRSQPFEQAVRVARAEGRDDLAVQFEMLKQRIEWRLFNRRARWPLAFLAITAACGWLFYESGGLDALTIAMLVLTFGFMGYVSHLKEVVEYFLPRLLSWLASFRAWLLSRPPPPGPRAPPPSWLVKWLLVPFFLLPPGAVYFGRWTADPLPWVVAMLIFVTLRLVAAMSHGVMRFMFGYLRRPVRAISTLVGVFLIGWIGVAAANALGMMVIDVEPVAGLVDESGKAVVVGAQRAASADDVASDIPCDRKISEPLYALDVLIPLIDLRQESRCEPGLSERAKASIAVDPPPPLRKPGLRGVWEGMSSLTTYNENFWDVLKALYALSGWFIVSLSILTFAHVNRSRVDSA